MVSAFNRFLAWERFRETSSKGRFVNEGFKARGLSHPKDLIEGSLESLVSSFRLKG